MSGEQKSRFMKWISPWLLLMEFMWIWLELSRQNLRACHQHRRRHSQYATVINLWWLERRALCGSTKRVLYPKWTYDCFDSHPVSSWGRIFWSYGFLHPSEFDQFDHGLVKLFIFFCLKLGWSRVFTKYLRLVMFRGGTWSTIGAIFFWSASHERNSIPRTL